MQKPGKTEKTNPKKVKTHFEPIHAHACFEHNVCFEYVCVTSEVWPFKIVTSELRISQSNDSINSLAISIGWGPIAMKLTKY